MSDRGGKWWEYATNMMRYWLACAANKWLGPAEIYWANPELWESYMEPYGEEKND